MIRRLLGIGIVFLLLIATAHPQGSAGTNAVVEPRALVDVPTAGMLPNHNLAVDMNFFQRGGVLAGFSVGIVDRLLIGVTYGGTSLLGTDKIVWNPRPGFNIKLRLLNESILIPAIALGFDSQGRESFLDSLDRYNIKSLGFYAVGSKNYQMLGFFSVHGGVNYTLDQGDDNRNLNIFGGVEKSLGPFAAGFAEYNFNLNDDSRGMLGKVRGYFNLGIRVSIGNGYTVGFNLKGISNDMQDISAGNRTMQIEYVKPF